MPRIAVAGGTGNIATEFLRAIIQSGKHEVTIFTRSEPSDPIPGLSYKAVDYKDLEGLTVTLQGFDACLSFLMTHLDVDCVAQKNLIHACINAGVKRFAPSEWGIKNGSQVSLYANKDETARYLHELGAQDKLNGLQYCLFQPSVLADYFAHPFPLSPGLITWPFFIDLHNRRAMLLDDGNIKFSVTAATDVSAILSLALSDDRSWPTIGGMRGTTTTSNELIALGKKIRGGEWTIEHVSSEDILNGELKTSWVPGMLHPAIPLDKREQHSKGFIIRFFKAMLLGCWEVSDEWNQRFPEYEFLGLEEYLTKAWAGKA